MKKFLLTLLALVWVSAAAFAGEYTIQFVGNGTDKDNTSAFTSAKPIADIVDVGAEYLTSVKSVIRAYQGKDGYGLKFSSGSGNGSLVLSLSADGAKKITKIVATAASWTGTTGNVDESTLSINGSDAIAMDGGDLKEYTFNYTNVTEDATTLEINAVKRLYVQKLVVTYEEEQTGPTEYVTFPADIVSSNTDPSRYTSTLTLTVNGAAQTISNLQSSSDKHIYKDATAQSATFAPGDVVTIQSDFKGSWMHGYLWIDYNQDFQFTADVDANDIPTATSELVGYTNYNANPNGGGYWHNSAGTRLTGGGDGCANQPFTFTIPADLAPGDYRARFIVDYNFFDPTPDPDRSKNKIQENGGIIADFTIHVEAASATLYTVTIVEPEDGAIEVLADGATVVNSGDQVEAGTELTFTATPAEGYEFTGLYINDIVKNINNPFVVNEDVTILATFYNKYYNITYTTPENGTLAVTCDGVTVAPGDRLVHGSVLTITATPADGYQLATLTANDAAIEGNTLTVTEDVTIAATFTEIPAVATRGSFTIPETSGSSTTELYSFRFDDAPLGSHTNGTIDDNDLRSRNFTYSAWLRIKSADGKPVMGNIQSDFSHACGAFLVTYSEGKLNFNGRNADANSSNFKDVQGSATTDEGTAIDEWVFVSVVADQANNTATLYKNGKAISSFATGYGIGLLADKGAFFIADNGASVEISEVQLWNKALTADELKDAYAFSYNANAVPENLVAYYRAGDFVEGSTTDLRNLGTEASAPGQMIKGRYYLQGGWNPQFLNQVAQDINVDGEGHVYKTVAVTAIQPEDEGNSFTITGAEGRAIENEANLYEKLTVVPALAEGVQLNGIKVVEGETETVYTLEQMPFYANADVTVSLDYTLPVVETRGSFTIPETTGNTNTQLYAFRFDDAPLGSHTNGTVDDNDLRSRNFTYSAWLRIKSADGKPIMGNIQTEFSHACGAFLVTYSDGKLNFNGRNADASSTNFKDMQGSATTDEGTAIDEWVFVSVVADQANNTVTLYKNGKAISSYATGYGIGLLPDAGSFFICDNGASVELSEVQLWNKALTADELKDAYAFSYNANAVPENLVAYYRAGDFVEGSTKALRNLGTEATTPAELLLGTYRVSGWSPYFSSPVAQDINVDGEGHVYKTVAVTAVQPEQEGCSFKITGNNGRAIETEANLYEKLTVVPTLAEGVEINGVKVVEGTTATTYTLDQMPFYANGDITVSLDFGTEVPNMYTVTFVAPENGTLEVLNGETVINSGDQVEENTVLTITATPAEGYQLATLTANDAAIEGNTLTVTEDVTIAATFAEAGQSYEIFDPTIRMSNGNRYTENITLMSEGQTQTISNLQANVSDYVYKDATDQVATFYAGKTVTATAGYNGSWMHGYLWIDYNKDYQFTPDMDANDIPTETSELVGFTGYNRDEAGRWHASDGTIFADGGGNANANQPISFTLPADLAPGDYRARFIVDWNAIEPNPDPNRSTNKIQANGGIIADFTIRIVEKNSFKVVANVTGGTASIEINGEGGFQDLPAEGMDVAKNAKVAVRFVPAASHYDLTSFEVNGVDETEDMSQRQNTIYSIASVDQDYTFNVAYTARKHTLTVINPQDVDPMQSWFGEFRDNNNEPLDMLTETTTEVEEGTSVFFVVMPPLEAAEEGEYELKTVTDNGADVTYELLPMDDGQYYMMGGITEDHTLIVTQSISGIIAISSDANNALKLENDILTIAADDAVIEVADINGRVLRKAQTSAMEVSDLVKGVYVAKAVTADATYTLKFIKL